MISHLGLYIQLYIFVSTSKSLYFCKCSMYKLPTNEFYGVILLFEVKKKKCQNNFKTTSARS